MALSMEVVIIKIKKLGMHMLGNSKTEKEMEKVDWSLEMVVSIQDNLLLICHMGKETFSF